MSPHLRRLIAEVLGTIGLMTVITALAIGWGHLLGN